MTKALVVYYSWSNGNTERIARGVQKALGADIDEIRTTVPYPSDYQTTVSQGKREVEEGFQPGIEAPAHDPEDYDIIAIGTPTWWYTMAPAVSTYLAEHDWSGKTVVPFMTNGGWPGTVIEDMEAACPGATFAHPCEIRFDSTGGNRLITPKSQVIDWIESLHALVADNAEAAEA